MHTSSRLLAFGLLAFVAIVAAGCGGTARLPLEAGVGPHPQLPAPEKSLIPVLHIAPAKGWPPGGKPMAGAGLAVDVTLFATGLDHPRWLYVLPNGDVLVAETNAPAIEYMAEIVIAPPVGLP